MSKEMTTKEALEALEYILSEYDFVTSDILDAEQLIKNALTELEALKRDVARYFELQYKNQFDSLTLNEIHKMYVLREKLSKVGKEDV